MLERYAKISDEGFVTILLTSIYTTYKTPIIYVFTKWSNKIESKILPQAIRTGAEKMMDDVI